MRRSPLTPGLILVVVTAFTAVATGIVLWMATSTPWLGYQLIPGETDVIVSSDNSINGFTFEAVGVAGTPKTDIEPLDLLAEPDGLPTYAAIDRFLLRQDQLYAIITARMGEVRFRQPDGQVRNINFINRNPHRPLWTMPGSFWVQLVTGIASLVISGWVWALRPRHLAPALFALSGLGVLMTTFTSALYAHRGLAMAAEAYAVLLPINHAGTIAFGGGMVGLFLIYPRRLIHPRWLWLIPAILVPCYLLDTFRLLVEADFYYNFILGLTVATLVLIGLQWWATRRSPDERAVLGWLGLSVAFGVGAFSFLSVAPQMLGLHAPLSQHYAAGALIIIYVGLALGLRRYRLFELGDWAYRILFYTVGAFLLLLLDALLIAVLNIGLAPSLAISLLLVALIYLPLRDWLWRVLFARGRIEQHELFSAAMEVAFAPSRADSAGRWRTLIGRLFDPLETREHPEPPQRPQISDDGLQLHLPSVAGAPALQLAYPFGGRGLFQPDHLSLASQLVALTERAEESRLAYMRGVGEERRRMARDLHDDVGARLLTGLHTADEQTRPTLQAALSDIRAIVSGLTGDEASLDRVLAEIRHEAARRLEASDIALDWPLSEEGAWPVRLDYRLHKAVTSAVREIVSNVIRHSGATALSVTQTASETELTLAFADNGSGLSDAALSGETPGYGLRNLRTRIADVGGTVTFAPANPGTLVTLSVPLVLGNLTPEPGVPNPPDVLNSPA